MGPPQKDVSKNKLTVIIKAMQLAKYTLVITKNKNVFTPEYQEALTDKLIKTAISIYTKCWTANNIRVTGPDSKRERLSLQSQAVGRCVKLLALMDLAKSVFHLKSPKIKFWASQAVEVKTLVRSWHESDTKRYKDV